ncbi:MAG: ABC transporter permease subunit [Deltaproteobacteria bacterium]|nr:ABC transporter permease subunit [Deltaproteobacteria bacterium]
MKRMSALFWKELKMLFISPLAYVSLAAFCLISGIFYYLRIHWYITAFNQYSSYAQMSKQPITDILEQFNVSQLIVEPTFFVMGIAVFLIVPILTIRLLSEERKTRTIELLLTSPIHIGEILFGKFFAILAFLIVMLLVSSLYFIALGWYGSLHIPTLLSGYFGIFLLGAATLAWGYCASAITSSVIIALVVFVTTSPLGEHDTRAY